LKLSHLVYAAAGYVLGARAGRERYDQIVSLARRVAGSQTVQATAGVVQGQFDQLAHHARQVVAGKLPGQPNQSAGSSANGYRR
jgi:urocanate hydratase